MPCLRIALLTTILASMVVASPTYDGSVKIPTSCGNNQLCPEMPENYPEDDFNTYVLTMQQNEFMKSPQYHGEPVFNEIYDDENCNIREEIIQPYIVRSNTTAKLVVQTKYYQQKVKQTTCIESGSQCFTEFKRPGYVAKCIPTYGTLKLYVYNTETNVFEYEPVDIPMCCSCGIESTK